MPAHTGNLRNATFSTSSGKDVKSTKQLSNGARPTAAWKSKNKTVEHTTGSTKMGPLGGRNARA
jgi:hypothetical protein